MKKLVYLLVGAFILHTANLHAQTPEFGVKAGLNLSNMSVEDASDKTLKTGFHAGVFTKLPFTDVLSVQPELLFSTKGVKYSFDNLLAEGETNFNLNYIEIPINLVYNLADDFEFHLGPYIGYLANANVDANTEILNFLEIDTGEDIDREHFKSFDLGLTAGLNFSLEQFVFGFKYNLGLTPVAKDEFPARTMLGDAKNSVIQLYGGIKF
jgi:hypothetical protein